ncbi:MAG TPA: MFS transporter [Candidatus Binatia bacterium]|nr:MFS transporter [Candidatus Binatia bacterium]
MHFLFSLPRREAARRTNSKTTTGHCIVMGLLRDLHRDAKLLMAARGIRAFAFSYLNVVFAIYLDRIGYSTVMIGVIFTVAYLSGAVLTALWGYLSDRVGRRNILMLLAVLTIISNLILVYFTGLFSFSRRLSSLTSARAGPEAAGPEAVHSIPRRKHC